MSDDAVMASLARQLADTLMIYARDRRDDDKKEIARLHTELCAARRHECTLTARPEQTDD